jgi:hypothetical protein
MMNIKEMGEKNLDEKLEVKIRYFNDTISWACEHEREHVNVNTWAR